MKKLILVAAVLCLSISSYGEEPLPIYSCKLLHKKGECVDIINDPLEKIIACAESGDMESQNLLSEIYYAGSKEVSVNHKEASKWLKMSAEQGCPEAQRLLGHFYYYGLGVPPSQQNAQVWWEKAALKKEPYAMCQLGVMHLQEALPNFSHAAAFKLINEAYSLYDHCGTQLAYIYYNGFGIKRNESRAKAILKAEISKGNKEAETFYNKLGYE